MKKNRFPVMTVALAAAALLGITVWRAALENGAQEEKKTSLRIGVLLYRGDDTFIGTLRSSMEQDAKEYEQETGIRVTLDVRDAKRNQMTQNSQAERMIGLNCDVLCVNMVDRSAASGVIDKAMEADIPIVFFNAGKNSIMLGRMRKSRRSLRGRSSLMPTGRIRHPLTGMGTGSSHTSFLRGRRTTRIP